MVKSFEMQMLHHQLQVDECTDCLSLVAKDEVICYHCGKPLKWGWLKYRLFKLFKLFSDEYNELYHEHNEIRMNKRSNDIHRKDNVITATQIQAHLNAPLSRRLEVI